MALSDLDAAVDLDTTAYYLDGDPVATNVTVTPSVVQGTTTIGTPTVSTAGNAAVMPATVQATTTIGTPTVTSNATPTPAVVQATTTIGTPTIGTVVQVTPSVVQGTTTIGTPTISVGVTVSPATVQATTIIGTPTGLPAPPAGVTVTPSTVACTVTIGTPNINDLLFRLVAPRLSYGPTTLNPVTRAERLENRVMRHFAPGVSEENVWVLTSGDITVDQPAEWEDVAHVYYGGHVNIVDADERAALEAAGFTCVQVDA